MSGQRPLLIRKQYIDSRFGQIHVRTMHLDSAERPLLLLHPMPYSSLYFTTLMPLINRRPIIAIDYPGCGGSDALDRSPTIENYAKAALDVLASVGIDGPCDFLGFHTGCLVAAEIAVAAADKVHQAILVDIPFFDAEKSRKFSQSLSSHKRIGEDLSCLQTHWDADVKSRLGVVPIERAFDIFADHINARGDGAEGFRAAFAYSAEQSFKAMTVQTLVIATQSGLLEATRAAAKIIRGAELMELLDITQAVFELGAERIAAIING